MTHSASIRPRPRKDGTVAFDVRFRLDGKSKSVSFETNDAASKWANVLRRIGPAEAVALLGERDTGTTPTLDEYAETYISGLSGVEDRTVEHYRMFMRLNISPTLGALPLDAITPLRIAGWVNLMAQTYAGKTIANRHGFLYAVLQRAYEDEIINRNPCARTRLPRTEASDKVFLSLDEYVTLLRYIPERHKPMVQLIAGTGMRWGEVAALKPGDFDLKARLVRINRAWHKSIERGWYIGPTKTKSSRRTISLPANLIPLLEPLVKARGDWMFANPDGSPIRHNKFMDNVWHPARRLANGLPAFDKRKPMAGGTWDVVPAEEPIGKEPGIHSLRHSHASWLIAEGVPVEVVQARLGHESIQTTIAVYTHLTPDVLARPAAAMDRMLPVG